MPSAEKKQVKKIVLTGGGTAGHVIPHLALKNYFLQHNFQVSYIGSKEGLEKMMAIKAGWQYYSISTGKLRRYLSKENIIDSGRVMKGIGQAWQLLRKIKPDIIFSKGGFVAVPVTIAAYLLKIPIILHESDFSPGLANRIAIPFARKICCSFPETLQFIKKNKGVFTGLPIRTELLKGSKSKARLITSFKNDKPVLLIIGGSSGSQKLNQIIQSFVPDLVKCYNICHLVGENNFNSQLASVKGYYQQEFAQEELPHLYALADFVISRAGATTIFELIALQKPHLLIPLSKKVSRGDQIENAAYFEKRGLSQVITEENLTKNNLKKELDYLKQFRADIGQKMADFHDWTTGKIIIDLLLQNLK